MRNVAPLLLLKTALPSCKLLPLRFAALPLSVSPNLGLLIMRGRMANWKRGHPRLKKTRGDHSLPRPSLQ